MIWFLRWERLCEYFSVLGACMGSSLIYLMPSDYQQQTFYKIMFLHVPLAILSIWLAIIIGFSSFLYLIRKMNLLMTLVRASLPTASFIQVACILTGSIWGKIAWGAWWVFDGRLTSMLILTVITIITWFFAHNFKRLGLDWQLRDQFIAVLCIWGATMLPIIKYSVEWWPSLHQKSSINVVYNHLSLDVVFYVPLLAVLITLSLIMILTIGKTICQELLANYPLHRSTPGIN